MPLNAHSVAVNPSLRGRKVVAFLAALALALLGIQLVAPVQEAQADADGQYEYLPLPSAVHGAAPRVTIVYEHYDLGLMTIPYVVATVYAYVKAGEYVSWDSALTAAVAANATGTEVLEYRLYSPLGLVSTKARTTTATSTVGDTISYTLPAPATADTEGVWRLDIVVTSSSIRHLSDAGTVDIRMGVRAANGVLQPGRVWEESIEARGNYSSTVLYLYTQLSNGALYEVALDGFAGAWWHFAAYPIGVVSAGTCEQLYGSIPQRLTTSFWWGNSIPATRSDTYRIDTQAMADCGVEPYHVFWNQPSADLPESARVFLDGATTEIWVKPEYHEPTVPAVTYNNSRSASAPLAGTITWSFEHFNGTYQLQIDANGNGSYTDPQDITVERITASDPTTGSYVWNGEDANGAVVSPSVQPHARVVLLSNSELHLVLSDVENLYNGLTVTQLYPNYGPASLMWDDSVLWSYCSAEYAQGWCGVGDALETMPYPGTTTPNERRWSASETDRTRSGEQAILDTWTFRDVTVEKAITLSAYLLEVNKTADVDSAQVGDIVTYTITATNRANAFTAANPASISDDLADVLDDATWIGFVNPPSAGTLALTSSNKVTWSGALGVNETVTIQYQVRVKSGGDGHLRNVVVQTGGPECTSAELSCATTDTPVDRLIVQKQASEPIAYVGDTVHYTVTLHNAGQLAYTSASPAVVFDDVADLLTHAAAGPANLTASAGTAAYDAATQRIRWSGPIEPGGTVTIGYDAAITSVGDLKVTNTGSVPLTDVHVEETAWGGNGAKPAVNCGQTTLGVGSSMVCSASYTVTQGDLDDGVIQNTARAYGTGPDPDGSGPLAAQVGESNPSTATVTLTADPGITIVKSADKATVTAAGEIVTYTYTVTNTGGLTLHDVIVRETSFTGLGAEPIPGCPKSTLAPGESMSCTAKYTVVQADLDAAADSFTNTATVSAKDPDGDPVDPPQPGTVTVAVDPESAIAVEKTADKSEVTAAGQTITYTFRVTNTGATTLTNVKATETGFSGTGTLNMAPCDNLGTLLPRESATCRVTYTVTQADIDSGEITNAGSAEATTPGGGTVTPDEPSETSVTADPNALLVIDKSADVADYDAVGDQITYTFTVTNTGNVTMNNVVVDDTAFNGAGGLTLPGTCALGSIAPGADKSCSATYTVTQADLDQGYIANTAQATGADPGGETYTSEPDGVTVQADQAPGLAIDKEADPLTVDAAGQTITYTYTVTNTGNVTLTDVKAVESSFDGNGAVPVPVCQATALAPGEATVCTATYTTVQGDIDDGSVTNVAVATATTPDGDGPGPLQPGTVTSDGDEADVKADQRPSATIVKTATVSTVSKAGDQVTYLFTVTNTGNVTLRDIAITEDFGGHGPAPVAICSHETLAPGQWMHCTAVYVVTQADIDAGGFNNTATVTANDPDGKPIDPASDSEVVTADMKPAISVVKTASTETVAAAGEEIVYTFTATNTGNVTLADVHIDESRFTGHGDPVDMADCADLGDLAPGESATCQAVYTVVQADIDAGSVVNAATAGGTPPDDPKTPGRDPETTPDQPGTSTVEAEQEPALEIVKTASPGTVSAAGDEITYTFTVTNTGNVTLTAVHADEAGFSGAGEPVDMSACADLGDLAPGESAACEAVYTVVQADIDAGSVTNAATAGGTPPDNPKTPGPEPEVTPGEPGTATVEAEQNPAITVVKTASADTVTAAGEVIAYTFTVTNTGNVTLTGVHVDEADFSGTGEIDLAECADLGELAPGESAACTADYTVTQADMDAGSITNAATAGGTPPDDPRTPEPEPEVTPDEPGTTTVEAEQSPALAVVKSATPTIVKGAGESVEYTFAVTNTGNVTLTDVSIDETAFGGTGGTPDVECPETPLAPGESLTCTATYEVTLADVIAGAITNVATAAATPPAVPGDPGIPPDAVSEPSNEVVVEVEQNPELTVVKTGEAGAIELPGDLIEYTFVVTNTGNLPLTGITVVETEKSFSGYLPNLSDIVCEETALDPGEQTTCRATYEVVLGDLQAGSVINEATAVGSPPDLDRDGEPDDPVHSDSNTVEIDASCGGSGCDVVHLVPSLKVVKTADKDVVRGVGDVITYTFEVVNDGEVDLTGIRIQELEFNGAGELSEITCEAEDLAVGESTTCTATYTVQPADMALESLVNTAIAAGTPPYSCPTCAAPDEIGSPIDDPDNTATVDVEPAVNQIKLVKSADRAHISAAGDQIVYSFAVTNLGDTTLTDVHVDDYQFSGTGELPQPTCPETTLEPGETVICTSVYIVTAEDVAAGTLTNTAVATGTPEPACSTCEEPEPISSAPDDPDVTVETPVRTNLPDTGTTVTQARVTIACTVAGIGLILSAIALGSRRRRQTATCQGGRDGVKRT